MTDSAARPRYLSDPNYYRLLYQLAAQLLHAEIAGQPSTLEQPLHDIHDALSAAKFASTTGHAEQNTLADRKAEVERFPRKLRFWKGLEPREEALKDFLDRQMVPCADLILAGALAARGRVEEADSQYSSVRSATRPDTSYRVHYNLACYASTRAAHESEGRWIAESLKSLRLALGTARGRVRTDLASWSLIDPSLAALRRSAAEEEFDELVADNRAIDRTPKTKSGTRPTRPSRSRRSRTGTSDLTSIREWAKSNGYEVSSRGRIPREVIEAYEASS
jgi:hypothetical protein